MSRRSPLSAVWVVCLALSSLLVACTHVASELARSDAPPTKPLLLEPEAETFVDDAEAKDGRAAILYRESHEATFKLDGVPKGTYKVSVRARADAYRGWPKMRLYLEDEQLGEDNSVERQRYGKGAQRFGETELEEGRVITARFLNDLYRGKGRDRNLIIDHLILEPVSVSSEPTEAPEQDERDPFRQPFTPESIWNMPLGSGAEYVEANLGAAKHVGTDVVHVLRMKASDSLRQAYVPSRWFGQDQRRCSGQEQIDLQLHLPDDYIVPDIGNSPYGLTPNSTFAFLLPDGETVMGGSVARCKEGGPVYLPDHFRWPENIENAKASIYGDGLDGSGHGATQLSSLGGLLRTGDLTGDEPIRHAVKLMIWGEKYLFYGENEATPGYRWPAKSADEYAPEIYGGTNPALQMGSLLAIPPWVSEEDLGLESKPGRKFFRALQNYGAYITEDPAWDAHGVTLSEAAYHEFEDLYGYTLEEEDTPWASDLNRLVEALHVVDNNGPNSIGGGGTPRRPLLPPLVR